MARRTAVYDRPHAGICEMCSSVWQAEYAGGGGILQDSDRRDGIVPLISRIIMKTPCRIRENVLE